MPNIKLTIAYDGTDFHGWQTQPGHPTIQGALIDLLSQITQQASLALHGAGRTDAGVHAWGQVANFTTTSELAPNDFARALNAMLPPTIRIRQAEEVAADFHARHHATAKTYRYRIYRGPVVPPFDWRYVLHHPYPLDFAAMAEAARLFEGDHDFTTFAASTGNDEEDQDRLTQRTILSSKLMARNDDESSHEALHNEALRDELHKDEWVYEVRGRSFLRNMVRKMVGTLLEVGRARLTPADIPRLLAQADRTASGPTAPPQGLCLHSIEYPEFDLACHSERSEAQ